MMLAIPMRRLLQVLLAGARIHHDVGHTPAAPPPASKALAVQLQGLEPGVSHYLVLSLKKRNDNFLSLLYKYVFDIYSLAYHNLK